MSNYQGTRDLAQEVAGGLIKEDINPQVQFISDQAALSIFKFVGGDACLTGDPGSPFKKVSPIIGKKPTRAEYVKWIKKTVPVTTLEVATAISDDTTTDVVLTAATYTQAQAGGKYNVLDPETDAILELVYCVSRDGSNTITVSRNLGSTSNDSIPKGSSLKKVGHAVQDYSTEQRILDIDPTTATNYLEIMREDWKMTLYAKALEEYGDLNKVETVKKEKLYAFAKYINHACYFGKGGSATDADSKTVYFMKGLSTLITSYIYAADSDQCSGFDTGHDGILTLQKYRDKYLRKIAHLTPDSIRDVQVCHGGLLEQALDHWYGERIKNTEGDKGYIGWDCKVIEVAGKRFVHHFDSSISDEDDGMGLCFPKMGIELRYLEGNGENLDSKHYERDPMLEGATARAGFFMGVLTLGLKMAESNGFGKITGVKSIQ